MTCATIASCDDFEAIVSWGEHHLAFLRRFSDFHHGVPCARWLRDLMNRIDPVLFARCFEAFVASMWPGKHDFIAIDGKTARRTHDKAKGLKALHTLSAYATNARLTLAQLSVPEKTNEITAIPDLLDTLAEAGQLEGAVVTIDAMGCQVGIASRRSSITPPTMSSALKGNQPTLEADVVDYFKTAPARGDRLHHHRRKGPWAHRDPPLCRLHQSRLDRLGPPLSRRAPLPRHQDPDPGPLHHRTGRQNHATKPEPISPPLPLDIDRIAAAIRGHWGVESMHWILDVQFKDDLSRYRQGHGAKNMAVVRRFALDLVRATKVKGSVKTVV